MGSAGSDNYDVVIIGAGIGGLVCGCYLAKAGMKVLILEQHHKPGGYCTSFRRGSFVFDAAAHSFGGYKRGSFGDILRELSVDSKITIRCVDPVDIVATPEYRINFWSDPERMIDEVGAAFPRERENFRRYLHFISSLSLVSAVQLRSHSFQDVLDSYLQDSKLKAILSFPLFQNTGLPPSRLSGYIGTTIFREFHLDGGYRSDGGMQALADGFARRFQELGGTLRFSTRVTKIIIQDKMVRGVRLDTGETFYANVVVSNVDARQTFNRLIGESEIPPDFRKILVSLTPSLSMFIVYLGLRSIEPVRNNRGCNHWFFQEYDLEMMYRETMAGNFRDRCHYLVTSRLDQPIVQVYVNAPFRNRTFWTSYRQELCRILLETIEQQSFPGLSKQAAHIETATPLTLFRYTLNSAGAAYGWESTPEQFALSALRKPSFLRGLHLVGHWTTQGSGVQAVGFFGRSCARAVLSKSATIT
jgi:phytoene dehydrogenase-like protein